MANVVSDASLGTLSIGSQLKVDGLQVPVSMSLGNTDGMSSGTWTKTISAKFRDISGYENANDFPSFSQQLTLTYSSATGALEGTYVYNNSSNPLKNDGIYKLTVSAFNEGTTTKISTASKNDLYLASKFQGQQIVKVVPGYNKLQIIMGVDNNHLNAFNTTLEDAKFEVINDAEDYSFSNVLAPTAITEGAVVDGLKQFSFVIEGLIPGSDPSASIVANGTTYEVEALIRNDIDLGATQQFLSSTGTPIPSPNALNFTRYDSMQVIAANGEGNTSNVETFGKLYYSLEEAVGDATEYSSIDVKFTFELINDDGEVLGSKAEQIQSLSSSASWTAYNAYPKAISASNDRFIIPNATVRNYLRLDSGVNATPRKFKVSAQVTGTVTTDAVYEEGVLVAAAYDTPYTNETNPSAVYWQDESVWTNNDFALKMVDTVNGNHDFSLSVPTYGIADLSAGALSVEFKITDATTGVDVSLNNTDDPTKFMLEDDVSLNKVNITIFVDNADIVTGEGLTPQVNLTRAELNGHASNAVITGSTSLSHKIYDIKALPVANVPIVTFVEPEESGNDATSTSSITFSALENQDAVYTSSSTELIYVGSVSSQNDANFVEQQKIVKVDASTGAVLMEFTASYESGTQYSLIAATGKKFPADMQTSARAAYVAVLDDALELFEGNYYSLTAPQLQASAGNNNRITLKNTVFKGIPVVDRLIPAPFGPTDLDIGALRIEGDMNANNLSRILTLTKDASGAIIETDDTISVGDVDIGHPSTEANPMTGDGSTGGPVSGTFAYQVDLSNIAVPLELDNPFLFTMIDTSDYKDATKIVNTDTSGVKLAKDFLVKAAAWLDASTALVTAQNDLGQDANGVYNYVTDADGWFADFSAQMTIVDASIQLFDTSISDVSGVINGDDTTSGSKLFLDAKIAARLDASNDIIIANDVLNDVGSYQSLWNRWVAMAQITDSQTAAQANAAMDAAKNGSATAQGDAGANFKAYELFMGMYEQEHYRYPTRSEYLSVEEREAKDAFSTSLTNDASLVIFKRLLRGNDTADTPIYPNGEQAYKALSGQVNSLIVPDASAYSAIIRSANSKATETPAAWIAGVLADQDTAYDTALAAWKASRTDASNALAALDLQQTLEAEYKTILGVPATSDSSATGLYKTKLDISSNWSARIAAVDTQVQTASNDYAAKNAALQAVRERYFDYSGGVYSNLRYNVDLTGTF